MVLSTDIARPGAASKLERLRGLIRAAAPLAVAYSGGLDSAFLLKVAHEELGDRALAITALSPSYASVERERGERLAREWGIVQRFVHTKELADPRYVANPPSRCFHCKDELFTQAQALLDTLAEGWTLADGTTCDDLGDFRPGLKAAAAHGVRHLLVEAQLAKADLRELARAMDLPIAELPGTACLASRFPYGVEITPEKLARIEAAETILREAGFHTVRVRDHEPIARIELAPGEIEAFLDADLRTGISRRIKALGFTYVALELEGYQTGSLNALLSRRDL